MPSRLLTSLGIAAATFVTALPARAAAPPASPEHPRAVEAWIDTTLHEISGHRMNPPRAARVLALVSVAIDRAAQRGVGRIPGAAAATLDDLFPAEAAAFDAQAAGSTGSARELALGRQAAQPVLRRAHSDGSDSAWTGTAPNDPGLWEPTLPAFAPPLEPTAGQWKTWNIDSGSAFRPPPPPPSGSPAFAEQMQAVYDVSNALTDAQRRIALYWADGSGTETPAGHWNRIAISLIDPHDSARHASRVFALLNTAQSDAFIACWDAKFAYWEMRPVTLIRRSIDPAWMPLLVTPPFPGYVSGHATTSGAASTVLAAIYPDQAGRLQSMAEEAARSRLYGGIHTPLDNREGLELGRRVGRAALFHALRRRTAT